MKTFNDPEAFARVKRLPLQLSVTVALWRDAARARGVDVIDLAIGDPVGVPPPPVVEALHSVADDSAQLRDFDPRGTRRFRVAAARWLQRRFGIEIDPEREVTATLGTEDGLGHALLGLLQDGDSIFAPATGSSIHLYGALLAGGETIPVAVGPGVDFMESLMAEAEKADRRPRGLIINFPSNPSTAVATPELLQKIFRFAEARDLFILSDASSCDLAFGGEPAPLMLQVPGARERTLEFVSIARSYDLAGFRIGFAAGNHALASALTRIRSYLNYGAFGGVQAAAIAAMEQCEAYPSEVQARYRSRRDALMRWFGAAGWPVPAPAATMFAWAPIPETLRHLGSLEFSRRMIEEAGVAVAPGVAFGAAGEGYVRIGLVEDEERLHLAAERVGQWILKIASEPRPAHPPIPRPSEPA